MLYKKNPDCLGHASNGTYFIQRLCEYIHEADADTKIQSLFVRANRDSMETNTNFVDFSTTMGDISFRDLASPDVNESDEINPSTFPATIKEFIGMRKLYKSKGNNSVRVRFVRTLCIALLYSDN